MTLREEDGPEIIRAFSAALNGIVKERAEAGIATSWRTIAYSLTALAMSCSEEADEVGEDGTAAHMLAAFMVEASGRSRDLSHAVVDDAFDTVEGVHKRPKRAV